MKKFAKYEKKFHQYKNNIDQYGGNNEWQFQTGTTWKDYDKVYNDFINLGIQQHKHKIKLNDYEIDLINLTQTNLKTSNTRKIQKKQFIQSTTSNVQTGILKYDPILNDCRNKYRMNATTQFFIDIEKFLTKKNPYRYEYTMSIPVDRGNDWYQKYHDLWCDDPNLNSSHGTIADPQLVTRFKKQFLENLERMGKIGKIVDLKSNNIIKPITNYDMNAQKNKKGNPFYYYIWQINNTNIDIFLASIFDYCFSNKYVFIYEDPNIKFKFYPCTLKFDTIQGDNIGGILIGPNNEIIYLKRSFGT